jgi:hypothetical protein
MTKYDLFTLEKIQELTLPIEEFGGKIVNLGIVHEEFHKTKNRALHKIRDQLFMEKIEHISLEFDALYKHLSEESTKFASIFLFFQEKLTKENLILFKQKLKDSNLSINEYGLHLIGTNKIHRIHDNTLVPFAPSSDLWLEVLNSLKRNSLYLTHLKNAKSIIKIKDYKPTEEISTQNEQIIEIEPKSELNKYEEYLKYTNKEFQKRRRREKRTTLVELQEKSAIPIEITKEQAEKIEDYKSKMKTDFNKKYFIQKDEEKDPVSLIKELRKKKEEEYNTYLEKIKKKKSGETSDNRQN